MAHYKRELIINVTFLILANLLIKPYYIFFVERKIQNQVGTAAWGAYFTLFSLSMLPQIILDLGLTSYINQRLSGHRDQLHMIWKDTAWVKPILALIFAVIFLLICYVGGYFLTYRTWILWITLNQVLISMILFLRAYISGLGHYRLDSAFSVADKFLFILLFSLWAWTGTITSIDTFLWIQTVSLGVPLILGTAWLLMRTGISFKRLDFGQTLNILKQSLPFAGIFVLMVLYCRMEPVWIGWLRPDGAYQAGIYAAGYRLLDAANMMGFLFAGILLPMFSHTISLGDKNEYQSVFDLSWNLMISLSVLICFPIINHHTFIMAQLYTDSYPGILPILMICLIPLTINYLLSTILTAAGRVVMMNYFFLISIGVSIVGHMLLTPTMGAGGAAIVLLITQVVTSFLLSYLVEKEKLITLTGGIHLLVLVKAIALGLLSGWLVSLLIDHPVLSLITHMVALLLALAWFNVLPWQALIRLIFKK